MEIHAVGAPASLIPLAPERSLSKTTLKTHALVVLSYLLIGIGIALACASAYMATMMSPMLAMATPVAPIALGILLKPSKTSDGIFSTSKAPVYIKGQPLGIRNKRNDCWLNSALQVFFHSSSGKALMENLSVRNYSLFPLRSAFRRYQTELADESGRPTTSVNTAQLRIWLNKIAPKFSVNDSQEDPMDFFREIIKRTKTYLPLTEQLKGKKATPCNNAPFISLLSEYGKNKSFNALFDEFFHGAERRWFREAPKGFLVEAYRTAPDERQSKKERNGVDPIKGIQSGDPIEFPFNLELTESQCSKGPRRYSAGAFIIHHGAGTESGHYTAYVHRNGLWWHAKDHEVTQVSYGQAKIAIRDALVVHYAQN